MGKYFYDGEWKCEYFTISGGGGTGFRRTHRHPNGRWSGITTMGIKHGSVSDFVCAECGAEPPDTMEGFIKLMEWDR